MRNGRRWIALDADFFANQFTDRLLDRFGPAGVCLFVAFLCACKRSRIQGQISYISDAEALDLLGLRHLPLIDSSGDNWCLDDLWKFTGTQKQTSRTQRGRLRIVKASHWALWQKSFQRQEEAERKSRSRQTKREDEFWTASGPGGGRGGERSGDGPPVRDVDLDSEIPAGADASQRPNGNGVNPARELKAAMRVGNE